ncbi:MAG: MlaD family protein [Deltaproteobacteria bacterium]|jgi:phospholipid/cholesterol/gamma-HCH transport system substrate-binding protein|nr:MlaD family protein [Deltaproteobacteria bacterium]
MKYTWTERIAGLILLLGFGLIALAMVLVGAGRDWLSSYQNYFVLFQGGYGLLPGVKVKFLRLDIGRVTSLELTDTNMVKIHLTILTEYASRLKGDSLASVNSPTIIGSEYLEIIPGSAESLPIPPGGQIPAKDPKTVEDVIASFEMDQKLKQVDVIMKNIVSLSDRLQDPSGPILGTMENLRRITGTVSAGEGSLGNLVVRTDLYDQLLETLKELRSVSESLSKTASGLQKDIPALTLKIDAILKQVESGTRSFPEVARGTREGIREVDQILDSIKRNFLIRGNLRPDEPPESLTRPVRER